MLCSQASGLTFRWCFFLIPWIRRPNVPPDFKKAIGGRPIMLLFNHTSMADPLIITSLLDLDSIKYCRTLLKKSLHDIPFFGGITQMTGHFPVYFKSDETGSFSVDREKQDRVTEEMEAHLKDGGTLCLFPEGQVNRNPTQLQTFRKGSFVLASKYQLPVWGCVVKGCSDIWPRGGYPGSPAKVEAHLFPIADPMTIKSNDELCALAEKTFQAEVDKLYKQEGQDGKKRS